MSVKILHRYIFEDAVKEKTVEKKGANLLEIVENLNYIPELSSVAFVDEKTTIANPVPIEMWQYIKPKNGTYVIVQAPAGDNVKQLLVTIVAIVAVVYGQPQLASGIQGLGASAATAGYLASAVVAVGVAALSAALISYDTPSVQAGDSSSPTLSITGTQNSINAGSPVPYHIGTNRFIPPLAAAPIREASGQVVYLSQVFVIGYAPVIISDIEIGDTPIENFKDVEVQINDGWSNSTPITTIAGDISTVSGLSLTLPFNTPSVVTGGESSEKASLIFAFNRGLVSISDTGTYNSRTVNVKVEYRKLGETTWDNASNPESVTATFYETKVFTGVLSESGRDNDNKHNAYDYEYYIQFNTLPAGMTAGVYFAIGGSGSNNGGYTALSVSGTTVHVGRGRTILNSSAIGGVRTWVYSGRSVLAASSVSSVVTLGTSVSGTYEFTDATTSATYRTVTIPYLEKAQYEFRCTRLTADSSSNRINDEISLVDLKTTQFTDDDGNTINPFPDGYAYIGVRIKATDQLSGDINQLSCKVKSVPYTYDDTNESLERTPSASGNNAWEYLTLLTTNASKKIVSTNNIDTDVIQSWADRCDEDVNGSPRHRINHVVDYEGPLSVILNKVASIGRAARVEVDGIKGVVMDVGGRASTQKFTNSNSWGFSATKTFIKKPDAFKCKFVNPDKGWTVDYINIKRDDNRAESSDDVIEELDCVGITDVDELYRYAKFAHAQLELRPEEYTINTGIESIYSTRGDIVTVSHDKIQGNVTSARVSSFTGNTIVLESPFPLDDSLTYYLSLRHSTTLQNSDVYEIDSINYNELTLLVDTSTIADLAQGDIAIMGSSMTSVDRKYIVKAIRPDSDLHATITMTDYADPDLYASEDGTIVDYNPDFYKPTIKTYAQPIAPVITDLYTDEKALKVNIDGSFSARIAIAQKLTDSDSTPTPDTVELSYRPYGSDGLYAYETYPADQSLIYANDIREGSRYDIRIRYTTNRGVTSEFVTREGIFVTGKTTPPDDVTGFTISSRSGNANLQWNGNTDVDLAGYVIRYSSSMIPTWGSSIVVTDNISKGTNQIILAASVGSYLIKAVDTGGRESVNATIVTNNTQSLENFNVVETIDESTPEFQGDKDRVEVINGDLRLSANNVIGDWESLEDVISLAIGNSGYNTTGVYSFDDIIDLGSVFSARLSADIVAAGIRATNIIGSWNSLAEVESLGGGSDDQWSVLLEVSTTQVDPVLDDWAEFQALVVGELTARAFRFRLTLLTNDEVVTPEISKLIVTVDMPDRVSGEEGLTAQIGGSVIPYQGGAFNAVPSVVADGEGLDTGDYYRITAKTKENFTIEFFNSSNASISRTFDYLAKGYGNEI